MKTEQYQACEFGATTNHGPFRVEGRFLVHDGLAVVLHRGYGANKQSHYLYASEYATGIEIACQKRSEMLAFLTSRIAYHGGAKKYLDGLKAIIIMDKQGSPAWDGEWINNRALLPPGYV